MPRLQALSREKSDGGLALQQKNNKRYTKVMAEQNQNIRPSKKQRELLTFIENFIAQHGYSPSYREIMNGLEYNSVATVALHVNSLIKRGHLRKRDRSARSLEVMAPQAEPVKVKSNQIAENQEKWLVEKVEHAFVEAEGLAAITPEALNDLAVLTEALKILGLNAAAQSFVPRLNQLKQYPVASTTSV
jgi:repressor LexA